MNELEISVFGPGVGESIVVHIGAGEWMIVDSCPDRRHKQPAALAYLRRLGLEPRTAVRSIVATHWDSDHIRGLGEVVEGCEAADIWCSAAIQAGELAVLTELTPSVTGFRLAEISRILTALRKRDGESATPRMAAQDSLVLRGTASLGLPDRVVLALSPSSAALVAAQAETSEALGDRRLLRRNIQRISRNDTSVALLVVFGPNAALLGGDLEAQTDPARGWQAAIGCAKDAGVIASMVKIPHHGSADAHDDAMWRDVLCDEPAAAVTPFFAGRHGLPRTTDRDRISGCTSNAYLTSDKPSDEDSLGFMSLAFRDAEIQTIEGDLGHVRWRRKLDGSDGWRLAHDSHVTHL
jgi:hypothetical protein